ncbi:MAG: nucleotidyltransferase family protein [Clostridia bacterium]|nr:nucleotidyltransferase family protein [Clostridia bacterium]
MDVQFRNLLVLLGNAINKADAPLTEPVDWGYILSSARFHKVLPLILEQAQKHPECISYRTYNEYLSQGTVSTVEQARKTALFLELYKAFIQAGVHPIVLKGIICRQLYGELCDHRSSGDEDILITFDDYEKVHKILTDAGYVGEYEGITCEQAKVLREVLYTKPDSPLRIELHFNAIGHENDWLTGMNDLFRAETVDSIEVLIDGIEITTLNHTEHFLFLICHALKHFAFCGLGIRQIVDILFYAKVYGHKLDKGYIISKLKELDVYYICSDFFHLGNRYLGFDFNLEAEPICLDELVDDIAESGIYGNKSSVRRTSSQIVSSAMSSRGKKQSRAKLLADTIFVDRRRLVNNYPELQEKPHLVLKAQYKRAVKYLKLKKERGANLTQEGIALSKKRIELFKKYELL